jgi:hypothetical protein
MLGEMVIDERGAWVGKGLAGRQIEWEWVEMA